MNKKCEFCGKEVKILAPCGCAGEQTETAHRVETARQHKLTHEPRWKRDQRHANWQASGSLSGEWISN